MIRPILMTTLCCALLSACGASEDAALTETIVERPWRETMVATGEIKAVERTVLKVPGTNWEQRRIIWMVPDGSRVKQGDVLVRFDAPDAQLKFDQSSLELLRTALKQAETKASAEVAQAGLQTELAQVDTDLAISDRYANADVGAFARNQILDAVQDLDFLKDKRSYLGWREDQTSVRNQNAEALVEAQGKSVRTQVDRAKQSLSELDVTAPNDGVFKLQTNWDGSKPQIGGSLWASEDFAEIPNESAMLVTFSVPQALASGMAVGMAVEARFAGINETIPLKLSRVGANASTRDRRSPVKFVDLDAAIPEAVVKQYGLAAGQAVRAEIVLVDEAKALSVPNLALEQKGEKFFVRLASQTDQPVPVEVGRRAQARSEIKSGIASGAVVLLTDVAETKPESESEAPAADTKDKRA